MEPGKRSSNVNGEKELFLENKSEENSSVPGKILYLDCFSGISGDMFLGALLDAGLPLEEIKRELSCLDIKGYHLDAEKTTRHGLTGTSFLVYQEEASPLRHLQDIEEIIENSDLKESIKRKALQAFYILGEVESNIHGVPLEKVHFHEIGAVDTVVDLVGAASALEIMGIQKVVSSPVPLGRGMVKIEHGTFPLPAPATASIITRGNIPVYGIDLQGELVTPTGAVLLSVLVDEFSEFPLFYPRVVGYGAGKKDLGRPNFLRVWLGDMESGEVSKSSWEEEDAEVIEANIDDLNPEISGYVLEKVMREGALDAYYTPVQMKKSRPAIKLSVISPPSLSKRLMEVIFQETSTLGCRIIKSRKFMLPRRVEKVETPWGEVRVKVAGGKGEVSKFAPEYEDCLAISKREQVPLKDIYRQVELIFYHQHR